MAMTTDTALARRARWLYELGRARSASRILSLVLPLLLLARLIGRPTSVVLGIGGLLVISSFLLAMIHDRYARAVLTGALAGLPAFLLPLLIRALPVLPLETGLDPCVPASALAGVIAGWVVARMAVDQARQLPFWVAAITTTALTGSLGCSVAGGGGVVGLIAGVLAGSAPMILRGGLRRS